MRGAAAARALPPVFVSGLPLRSPSCSSSTRHGASLRNANGNSSVSVCCASRNNHNHANDELSSTECRDGSTEIAEGTASARRSRRVRVRRSQTYKASGWEWRGRKPSPQFPQIPGPAPSPSPLLRGILRPVDEKVRKFLYGIQSAFTSGNVEMQLVKGVARLGKRLLRSLQRTFYPHAEEELILEYGITDPHPDDKTFVDPLTDWDIHTSKNVCYYRDSFGKRVFLRPAGGHGLAMALEFRELADEETGNGENVPAAEKNGSYDGRAEEDRP